MDTVTPPPAPRDDGLTALRARFYQAVADTAVELGAAPGHVGLFLTDKGRRHAVINFDTIAEAGTWVDWLHWPSASNVRDGRLQLAAYGQWCGFACSILANDPAPAPTSVERWWFTFGAGQEFDGRYVIIDGPAAQAREQMIAHFGRRWSHQYSDPTLAGVDEFRLAELPRVAWPAPIISAAGRDTPR